MDNPTTPETTPLQPEKSHPIPETRPAVETPLGDQEKEIVNIISENDDPDQTLTEISKLVDDEAEKTHIYDDLDQDPAIKATEDNILADTNLDPEVKDNQHIGPDGWHDNWNKVNRRENMQHWDSFVVLYPEKATAYAAQGHEQIKQALQRRERNNQQQEPVETSVASPLETYLDNRRVEINRRIWEGVDPKESLTAAQYTEKEKRVRAEMEAEFAAQKEINIVQTTTPESNTPESKIVEDNVSPTFETQTDGSPGEMGSQPTKVGNTPEYVTSNPLKNEFNQLILELQNSGQDVSPFIGIPPSQEIIDQLKALAQTGNKQ